MSDPTKTGTKTAPKTDSKKTEAKAAPATENAAAGAAPDAAPEVDMSQFGLPGQNRSVKDVNPFENIPSFVPGKNLEPGRTLAGTYLRTKRVVSDKLTAGKRDANGKRYRDLHILKDARTGAKFGVWSVGQLGAVIPFLKVGQYVEMEYLGLAEKSIRPGQSPAHEFKIRAEGEVEIDQAAVAELEDLPEGEAYRERQAS